MTRIKNKIDFQKSNSVSKLLINSIAPSDNYKSREDYKYSRDSLYEDEYIR